MLGLVELAGEPGEVVVVLGLGIGRVDLPKRVRRSDLKARLAFESGLADDLRSLQLGVPRPVEHELHLKKINARLEREVQRVGGRRDLWRGKTPARS